MITITEALAELATIDKRLAKKAVDVKPYAVRLQQIRDPLEKSGGSEKYIAEQRQSLTDLITRKIDLRRAVAQANADTMLTVGGREMSVADWLVWKREGYQHEKTMLDTLLRESQQIRQAVGGQVNVQGQNTRIEPEDVVIAFDEREALEAREALEETYGRLDGLLSLKNALTTIE